MSETSPLVKRSLVDQALDQLRQRINQGNWVVGQRLPTEPELSAELGISRNTVREAMRVLAFSGLIATVWLVAFAWNSPDRNLILGTALVLPLIIVAGIALYLRKVWNEKLFLHHSRIQLNDDWTVLNHAMKEKPANPQE